MESFLCKSCGSWAFRAAGAAVVVTAGWLGAGAATWLAVVDGAAAEAAAAAAGVVLGAMVKWWMFFGISYICLSISSSILYRLLLNEEY